MIIYHKNNENGLVQLNEPVHNSWIQVQDPTPKDLIELAALDIPQDLITPALDLDERSRTERDEHGVLMILLRVPIFQGEKVDLPYSTQPLGILLTEKYLVTVSRGNVEIIDEFASGRAKGLSTGKRNRFVLRILLQVANRYLHYLREIEKIVAETEDRIQQNLRNKEVLELLKYQKSLVYFTTALKANELVLERLQRTQLFKMYPDDEDLLDDVIIENQQAIEMVTISSSILTSMMDAFGSIISNNLNTVLKFLTSVTIVLSIPAIVSSFMGMNANLPFLDHPLGTTLVGAIFLLIAGVVVYLFMRRDWS